MLKEKLQKAWRTIAQDDLKKITKKPPCKQNLKKCGEF